MAISFRRAKLTLSNNSSTVAPVEVRLNDDQNFVVDPQGLPSAENQSPLSIGTHPNPFFITNCKSHILYRTGILNIDPNAIPDWHSVFDSSTAIVLPMQLAHTGPLSLTFDTCCTEHSTASPTIRLERAVREAAFFAFAILNFAVAVLTFRFLRRPKSLEDKGEPVHTAGH